MLEEGSRLSARCGASICNLRLGYCFEEASGIFSVQLCMFWTPSWLRKVPISLKIYPITLGRSREGVVVSEAIRV